MTFYCTCSFDVASDLAGSGNKLPALSHVAPFTSQAPSNCYTREPDDAELQIIGAFLVLTWAQGQPLTP